MTQKTATFSSEMLIALVICVAAVGISALFSVWPYTQIRSLQGQNNQLQNQINQLQSQVDTLTTENNQLQSQVSSLESERSQLQNQISALQSENAKLQNQLYYWISRSGHFGPPRISKGEETATVLFD